MFEAEYLEHRHERETFEELLARRQGGRCARRSVAWVGRDYGERDELRERVRAGYPTGKEGLFEVDATEARVCSEEVVGECDRDVGQCSRIMRIDIEPEILEERCGCLEEAHPAGRIA